MKISEIYNGSQWAHDIFLVNKAGAMEYMSRTPGSRGGIHGAVANMPPT